MIHDHPTIEFPTRSRDDEDRFLVSSPPLWGNIGSRSGQHDHSSSPLLPHGHHHSASPASARTRAIVQGRRELMEMVQSMPESCYELSLKDMVEEPRVLREEEEVRGVVEEEASCYLEREGARMEKQKMKKGGIKRAKSMEKEVFQIKMLFSSSLGPKRKGVAKDGLRVSPTPSFQQSESDRSRDGWIKRFLVVKNSSSNSSSNSRSSSSSSSSVSRRGKGSLFPSCWPFMQSRDDKGRRRQGCMF